MICLMSVSHEVPHEALRLMRKERARYRNGARFRFRFFLVHSLRDAPKSRACRTVSLRPCECEKK